MTILMEIAKAQKASEERQSKFEARIEKKMEQFMNGNSQSRNLSAPRASSHLNAGPNRSNRNRYHQELDVRKPDWDDFEKLDENFPIDWVANVPQLEEKIRTDLEFQLLLVIIYLREI